jgi:hypothetical protein
MTNFDVVPDSGVNAGVRLYGDSMEPLPRRQTHEGERQAVIGGGTPTSGSDGLEPGAVTFRGTWLGTDASALAERLRAMADDPGTQTVTVQARDSTGSSVSSSYNGSYRILGDGAIKVKRTTAGSDLAYEYSIQLTED